MAAGESQTKCILGNDKIYISLFRLRASRVLLVGIKGLGAEICKNLVLSGVKSVTIVDPYPVEEQDFVSQFLVQRQDLGKNVSTQLKFAFVITCSKRVKLFFLIKSVVACRIISSASTAA